MGDHHVHLHPHGPYNGTGPALGEYPPGHIEAYVETALARGADEVGFTEHFYRCADVSHLLGAFWEAEPRQDLATQSRDFVTSDGALNLEDYVVAVVAAKDRGLPVKLGLEVDYFPESIAAVCDHLAQYPFDFLIGSVHWVGGWSVDHDDVVHEYERRGVEAAYADYFALETALAASGAVDVLAHADVIKKFGHRLPEPPVDWYRKVAAAAAESGTAIEVSTAGRYKPVAEMYPAPEFLAETWAAGVGITLASDAHEPGECGRDRDVAIEYARAAGYTTRLRFENRNAIEVPLQ
ncbi:MAG: histidinol-phosphatase HisJ family protein [Acidimicrobiia bacterium]|nr:histidinol-phosphatase HisJ family protein [Acidimicrobiia bacterium]